MGTFGETKFDLIKFIDYSPHVFNSIRYLYGISPEDYIKSLGNENLTKLSSEYKTMNQQSSSGKSGSFFFYTSDNKYMVKTIPKREFDLFIKFMPKYFSYLMTNTKTLLVKYFGLHKVECLKQNQIKKTLYITVMKNLLEKIDNLDYLYDLKGSLYKRYTPLSKQKKDPLKDLNFLENNEKIYLNDYDYCII